MRFSVIVPVYNTEKYLQQCLDSLLSQSFTDFEVICVNDGSTDGSSRILKSYALKDSRINHIDIPNGGVSTARNTALDRVSGDYILFVDSDDWISPDALSRLNSAVESGRYDIVAYNFTHYFEATNSYTDNPPLPANTLESGWQFYNRYSGTPWFGVVWRMVISADCLKRSGCRFCQDISHFEDMMFTIDLCSFADRTLTITDSLYFYRRFRTGSQMSTNGKARLRDMAYFANNLAERFIPRNDIDKSVLYVTISSYYRNCLAWSDSSGRKELRRTIDWESFRKTSSTSVKTLAAYYALLFVPHLTIASIRLWSSHKQN